MQYIVVITDRKLNTRYVLEHVEGNRTQIGIEQRSPDLDEDHPENMLRFDAASLSEHWNIYFTKSEAEAKAVAHEMAQVSPNKNVFWAKLLGAFESVPSRPVEKTITEKGILPV